MQKYRGTLEGQIMKCVFGALIVGMSMQVAQAADDIAFAPKTTWGGFLDDDSIFGISGALTGDLGYPNNTHSIVCMKARKECWITSIDQIGPSQLGGLRFPYSYPIVSWTESQIVAREELSSPGWDCLRTTITIDRKTSSVQWADEPIDQANPKCSLVGDKVRLYTIEDPPGWTRFERELNQRK